MNASSPVLQRISRSALDNSPVLEKVGLWMAAHPLRAIALSADGVAQQSGASLAAVNRFARSAGFEGFAHLKTALAEELQDTTEPIRKLMPQSHAPDNGSRGAGHSSLGTAQRNLQLAAQALDAKALDQAARRMLKARILFTLGFGISSYLAETAAHLAHEVTDAERQLRVRDVDHPSVRIARSASGGRTEGAARGGACAGACPASGRTADASITAATSDERMRAPRIVRGNGSRPRTERASCHLPR